MSLHPLKKILELFLKPVCPGCGSKRTSDEILCKWCTLRVVQNKVVHWSTTGKSFFPSGIRAEPMNLPSGISVHSVFEYCGIPRELILRLKYKGERWLAGTMAELIYEYSDVLPATQDLIVPIPADSLRKRERGYNQAALIARRLAGLTGNCCIDLLGKKPCLSQVGLNLEERRENVKDVFYLKKGTSFPRDAHLWLIDDVASSFSTMNSASKVLLEAGAFTVTGLSLTYRKTDFGSMIK